MSISTLESPETRAALAAHSVRETTWQAAERGAREEIAEAFKLMRTLPPARVAVPYVEVKGGGLRVQSMSLDAVIRDLVTDGHGGEQLLAVLQASECPMVQKLRDELCAQWQRQWASDIAEARS